MCSEWRQNGLTEPKKIVEASIDYVESKDVFKQWENDCLVFDIASKDFTGTKKMLESHEAWCNERSIRALDLNAFSSRLKELTSDTSTTRAVNGVRVRGYIGVKLIA